MISKLVNLVEQTLTLTYSDSKYMYSLKKTTPTTHSHLIPFDSPIY